MYQTIRYIVEYQKPAGYGLFYELESFLNRKRAIKYLVKKKEENPTHTYRLIREIRIEEPFSNLEALGPINEMENY